MENAAQSLYSLKVNTFFKHDDKPLVPEERGYQTLNGHLMRALETTIESDNYFNHLLLYSYLINALNENNLLNTACQLKQDNSEQVSLLMALLI